MFQRRFFTDASPSPNLTAILVPHYANRHSGSKKYKIVRRLTNVPTTKQKLSIDSMEPIVSTTNFTIC